MTETETALLETLETLVVECEQWEVPQVDSDGGYGPTTAVGKARALVDKINGRPAFTYNGHRVEHINAFRWFQKSYGNTYHSVYFVLENGDTVKAAAFEYGYGDQWLQTAYKLAGLEYGGTRDLREVYGVTYNVTDVDRKRDL